MDEEEGQHGPYITNSNLPLKHGRPAFNKAVHETDRMGKKEKTMLPIEF